MSQSAPILPNVTLHGNKPSTVLTETVQHPLAECQAFLDFLIKNILYSDVSYVTSFTQTYHIVFLR